jgi:hypothetical protein
MGWQSKANLIVVALAVLVGLLEATVRFLQRKYRGIMSGAPQALRDRYVAWRLNPKYRRVDIQHNSSGFRRAHEVSIAKPPGTVRIFLMGGSAVYGAQGAYPHIEGRYARIYNHELIDAFLENTLNDAYPQRRFEVINCASSGYRVHQQLALLQSRLLRYRPDIALLIDGYNDFIQLYNGARDTPHLDFDVYENTYGGEEFDDLANPGSFGSLLAFGSAWLGTNSALVRILQGRVYGMVRNPWREREAGMRRSVSNSPTLSELTPAERSGAAAALANARYYAHTVRQIHRMLALDGIKCVCFLQPILLLSGKRLTDSEKRLADYERDGGGALYCYLFRQIYNQWNRDLAEASKVEGFEFINLEDVFNETDQQAFTDFAHLTPDGNRIVAQRIFQVLQKYVAAEN